MDKDGIKTFNTNPVELLSIETKNVKFIPAGIKKNFPNLKKFEVIRGGLIHLEREDMRQFGSDLISVSFWKNTLTALEGDLFEFNPNLEYIGLHHNALKFINPSLFENFKKLTNLQIVEFDNSTCIDQESRNPKLVEWNYNRCNDVKLKKANLRRISDRENFFIENFSQLSTEKQLRALQISDLKNEFENLKANTKIRENPANTSLKQNNSGDMKMASILAVYFLSLLYIIFLHCKIVTHEKHFNSQRETRIVENGKQNNISLTIRNDSNTMNAYSHNQSTNMNNPKQMTKVDETSDEDNLYDEPRL